MVEEGRHSRTPPNGSETLKGLMLFSSYPPGTSPGGSREFKGEMVSVIKKQQLT